MLTRWSDSKQFFTIERKFQRNSSFGTSEDVKNYDASVNLFEIQIKPRFFNGRSCSLLVIRNISHVVRQQKLQADYEYQQLLVRTMSHEQLTPLNSIINMAEIMQDDKKISPENRQFLKVIWSSGKILEFSIKSQLS